MKTFEIRLRLLGNMTLLPDSQRIFGCLMNLLNQSYDGKEISDFVEKVKNQELICNVSNLFPTGYRPMPNAYIMELLEKSSILKSNADKYNELKGKYEKDLKELNQLNQRLNDKKSSTVKKDIEKKNIEKEKDQLKNNLIQYKKEMQSYLPKSVYGIIKKIDFIKKEDLGALIREIKSMQTTYMTVEKIQGYDCIYKEQTYIQKYNIASYSKQIPGFPNIAYVMPEISYRQNSRKEVQKDFSFLVQVDGGILKKFFVDNRMKLNKQIIYLGAKASHGYNGYEILRVKERRASNREAKQYLNMGMLLPNSEIINWEKSAIDIYSSDRRAFEISDKTEKVISFIKAGSVINIEDGKSRNTEIKNAEENNGNFKQIGKCIENKYNVMHKEAIVFGNSYLEAMEDKDEKENTN